jgi:hypothetical protein
LLAMLMGKDPAVPGVEVRRCKVWPSLVVLIVLVAFGAWAYDYFFSGRATRISGKAVLGLLAWPFICVYWGWNVVRGLRFRSKGQFGWVLSDTHFLFVPPGGSTLGQLPLTAIAGLSLRNPPQVGAVLELTISGSVAGQPAQISTVLSSLGGEQLGLLALRPSNSKALFRALRPKLQAANPSASIEDETANIV